MIRETLSLGPLQCNCTVLGCPETREAVVVDPGAEEDRILTVIRKHGLRVTQILLTHAHFDHIGAVHALQKATGARVCLHEKDMYLNDNLSQQTALFGFSPPPRVQVDHFLQHGETIAWGRLRLKVLHTPGHSPGGVCFLVADQAMVLTGDTLFYDSIGRTDLWGGDHTQLLRSIREQLLVLEDATRVVPGHGPDTTIGRERRENPFLQEPIF